MTSEQEARKLLFKYNEDLILDEVRDYIKSTYGEHYAGGDKNIQIQDVFEQMDISEEFTRGCAMKYLFRFGKKNGKNRKDLLKCIHYVCLLYFYSFQGRDSDTSHLTYQMKESDENN
tara:strand:+ start:51 stop:401 length:351 start_codon:yes stop_codon:yes gene_type:complete